MKITRKRQISRIKERIWQIEGSDKRLPNERKNASLYHHEHRGAILSILKFKLKELQNIVSTI